MIRFTVHGEAKPAGSKRAFRHPQTDRIIVTDSSGKKGKDWRRAVADAAAEAREGDLLDGPLEVRMTFYRQRPKSHFGSGRNSGVLKGSAPLFPTTRPDLLKLARAAEDSMTGVLYADDAQIVDEYLHKRYGPACLVVEVVELADSQVDNQPLREAA